MPTSCWLRPATAAALLVLAVLAAGCAEMAHRPYVQASDGASKGCASSHPAAGPASQTTPETSIDPPYRLHFLEFDDQGWSYQPPDAAPGVDDQVDCAIGDLAHTLDAGHDVLMLVYVHGWHHSADAHDRDLNRFRDLLQAQARRVQGRRTVLGYYIGWNGETFSVPLLRHLSFWGRKNAAHHVSEGTVREFFARIKALRDHYNRPNLERAKNCGNDKALTEGHPCPIRAVMMGHSFGAWILYSATSPYLLEALSSASQYDLQANRPRTERERGIADLVVLLNPAFEASRYEPIYRAARRYRNDSYAPPLLVSLTSTADLATRVAFPLGRFFNSIFQYPATSDEESRAMKATHGHLERYITHELTLDADRAAAEQQRKTCLDANGQPASDDALRRSFFASHLDGAQRLQLPDQWSRPLCGGLLLQRVPGAGPAPDGIIWNVRTHKEVIPNHDEITTPQVLLFVQQLYEDVTRTRQWKFR